MRIQRKEQDQYGEECFGKRNGREIVHYGVFPDKQHASTALPKRTGEKPDDIKRRTVCEERMLWIGQTRTL